MRLTRQFWSLGRAIPFLVVAAWVALQAGCQGNDQQFYTYCDNTGCYRCDANGCGPITGNTTGAACQRESDCAPGCYCAADGKCAEAGFCDRDSDCATGFVCDVARHSCEPASSGGDGGTGGNPDGGTSLPQACTGGDCGAGAECANGACEWVPVPPNHCVFNRQCGAGGICEDGQCQQACSGDAVCGTGRSCQGGRCQPGPLPADGCVANGQCGAAQTCIDAVCHLSCTKDGDCGAGDLCIGALCRPDTRRVPECASNAACAAALECVDAQCRTFCMSSSDCALCVDGNSVCQGGYCVTPNEANPQCQLANACGGAHCTNGTCVR